jgi:hypothetical protein
MGNESRDMPDAFAPVRGPFASRHRLFDSIQTCNARQKIDTCSTLQVKCLSAAAAWPNW